MKTKEDIQYTISRLEERLTIYENSLVKLDNQDIILLNTNKIKDLRQRIINLERKGYK